MHEDGSPSEIAHGVLRSIRQIMRKVAAHSWQMSGQIGLTVPQLMCLKAVGDFEEEKVSEITVAAVASRVQLSPATVSRIIDRLVRGELVLRERKAKDRRRVCLSLTTSGLERFQNLPTPLQEKFVERLLELPQEERNRLLSALRKISSLMDAEEIDAAPILHTGEVFESEAGVGDYYSVADDGKVEPGGL
jgi:DNA-binding MarR family transcriptional regulator